MKERHFSAACQCLAHCTYLQVLHLDRDICAMDPRDDDYYVDFYVSQENRPRLRDRLWLALRTIFNYRVFYHGLILSRQQCEDLRDWLNGELREERKP